MGLEDDADGLTEHERLLVAIGDLTREEIVERTRVRRESESEWPDLTIRWDFDRHSAHHSLDGVSREDFEENHPAGSLSLVWVPLASARKVFCGNVRREDEDIWSLGDKRKLARALLWWIEGNAMTPPYLRIVRRAEGFDRPDCVTFNGGHHRFGICAARGLDIFPAYIDSVDLEALIS